MSTPTTCGVFQPKAAHIPELLCWTTNFVKGMGCPMYSGGPIGGHLAMATKTVIVEFQGPSRIVFFQKMKKKMENAIDAVGYLFHVCLPRPLLFSYKYWTTLLSDMWMLPEDSLFQTRAYTNHESHPKHQKTTSSLLPCPISVQKR